MAAVLVAAVMVLMPGAADAATTGHGILAPVVSWFNDLRDNTIAIVVPLCVIAWVATVIYLLAEGLKMGPLLFTIGGLALGTSAVLIAPSAVTAISGLFGIGALI